MTNKNSNLKNHKLEGLYRSYHQNGKLQQEGNYLNNKKHGLWRVYNDNGQLEQEVNWKHDIQEGITKFYNNNGCLLYTSPSPRDRQKSRMPSSA